MTETTNFIDVGAKIDGSLTQLNDLLAPVQYRPGLSMKVHAAQWYCEINEGNGPFWPYPCVHYEMNVRNTYHPEETLNLHMHTRIPKVVETIEDFLDYCLAIALWFDDHEGREWFRFHGRPWRDPHSPLTHQKFDPIKVFEYGKSLRPANGSRFVTF